MKPLAALVLFLAASPAAAQLRPLPEAPWHRDAHFAECGVAHYADIGVGLLGARGRLESLGDCAASVDLGGARIQLSGVVFRSFRADTTYAAPVGGVDPDGGPVRRDWGDFVLETLIPFRPAGGPWVAGLRFGARFPTTDNRVGLERDRTDLHVTAMGGWATARVAAHVELGVGINGTRVSWREQQDVLLYSGGVEYGVGERLRLRLGAVGHAKGRTERGNETLGEVHAGARWGNGAWLDVEAIAGYTAASPLWGLRVRLGRAFGHQ